MLFIKYKMLYQKNENIIIKNKCNREIDECFNKITILIIKI